MFRTGMVAFSRLHCVVFLAGSLLAATARGEPIEQFFQTFAEEWVQADPDLATATRYFSGPIQRQLERQMTPQTRTWQHERVERAKKGLKALARFKLDGLADTQRVSAQLMKWQLDRIVAHEDYLDYWYPLQQFSGANVRLVENLTVRHPLASEQDVLNYLARMEYLDDRMDEATLEGRRLARKRLLPPGFIIDRTIEQMREFMRAPAEQNPLVTSFAQRMELVSELSVERRVQLAAQAAAIVKAQVYPAWSRAMEMLDEVRSRAADDAGLWRLRGGAEAYAEALRRFTTTAMTPEKIHTLGLAHVVRIEAEMDRVLRELGRTQGTVRERIAQLKQDLAYRNPLDEDTRALMMRDVNSMLQDAQRRSALLFASTPLTLVMAKPFPKFREATASANYNRAPLDGSQPAVFQIPLREDRMTRFGLRTLVYHETVPGHHFQIAIEQENASLPRFRQARVLGGISALSEGWALYAEQLAVESGWYEGDPEGLLGQLEAELFRARRLVVDTGLHAKRWTREQAIEYGFEPSEVDRYIVNPGQACSYFVGELRILELRYHAAQSLGGSFSLQKFHSAVLNAGTVPLDVLAEEIDRFIAAHNNRGAESMAGLAREGLSE